jgi:hypothetical protein
MDVFIIVVIVLVVIVALAALVNLGFSKRAKQRAEVWKGTVTDKKRNSPDGQNMYHYVAVKLDDGQQKTVRISGKLWKTLSVGDKLDKQAGKYNPTKA